MAARCDLTHKKAVACVHVDGKNRNLRLPLKNPSKVGFSYVHYMASPANSDAGIYVEWVKVIKEE